MKTFVLLLTILIPSFCSAQQVHVSYRFEAQDEDGIGAIVTTKVVRVYRRETKKEIKKEITPEQWLGFADLCLAYMRTEIDRPVVTDPSEVANPMLQMHVFTGDRTISYTANPKMEELRFLFAGLGELLGDPEFQEKLKEGEQPALDDADKPRA